MSVNKRSLLLLPFSLKAPSRHAIASLYKQPLSAALSQSRSSKHPATLSIAVVGDFLRPPPAGDSSSSTSSPPALRISWPHSQSVLAGVYSLVAYLCAQQSIATDANAGPNSVDARVVLVHDDRSSGTSGRGRGSNGTVLQSLSEFARNEGSWTSIFHPEGEEGLRLADYYCAGHAGEGRSAARDLLVGLDSRSATRPKDDPPAEASTSAVLTPSYPVVCLGGTFDHLHPGHKLLLSAAALLLQAPEAPGSPPSRFVIGVTGDEMLRNKKFAEYVQSWEVRARGVLEFVRSFVDDRKHAGGPVQFSSSGEGHLAGSFRGGAVVVECVVFQDIYGPTVTVETMDALVVSGETRSGGRAVNEKRRGQGWRELEVYEVDVLDARGIAGEGPAAQAEDFGAKISSTAIRQQKAMEGAGGGRL